ncbi:hypothetical protein niasHT_009741 [Heterodera trifolii]|uniref:BTB domain-containing protein n=1 Tax=Heterodera trifolii TaxID=157864 RepID=A0ABD2M606_9BILA
MSSSLADRMKLMLSTGEDADVHFLVGQEDANELIQAHKVILKRASDVFGAMFRFDSKKEKTENISAESLVVIPDIEAQAFKVMLSFIYAEDLSELNGDNVMAVLFAANKYNFSLLVKACLDFPINELSDVFLAYKQAHLLNKKNFARRCMDYIEQNVETLTKSESFLQIDQNLLCEIFDHNMLLITNEFELWKAALRWADEKCRQNAIECSAENRRSALGPALFKVRFPLISRREFSQNIVPSGVLTMEEFVGIYQFHCHPNFSGVSGLYPLQFSSRGRISDRKKGRLILDIEKFSEFAQLPAGSCKRFLEDYVYIGGLPWIIMAKINTQIESTEKWMDFFLWCIGPKQDEHWNCKCSATLRIVSRNSVTEDLIGKLDDCVFNNKSRLEGFPFFTTCEHLMDPDKGFYDKDEDKVTMSIEVAVKEQKGTKRKLSDE